jgi:hypothetical protein
VRLELKPPFNPMPLQPVFAGGPASVSPFVSSTLGWILYKRGVYQRALALLREGAVRLPDNPELQYHLGMAAARTGDRDVARRALAFAAGSPAVFKSTGDVTPERRAILGARGVFLPLSASQGPFGDVAALFVTHISIRTASGEFRTAG